MLLLSAARFSAVWAPVGRPESAQNEKESRRVWQLAGSKPSNALLLQTSRHLLHTPPAEISRKHDHRPPRHVAAQRIGRAMRPRAQHFVPHHNLPRINHEGEGKKRPRQRRQPMPLLGHHDLPRYFALALLDRELAGGKVGGHFLGGVLGRKLGTIGRNGCFRERTAEEVAEPGEDAGQHGYRSVARRRRSISVSTPKPIT